MLKLARLKIAASLACTATFALGALEACSGDDNNGTNDGGQDATTNDVVTTDASGQDVATDSPQTGDGGCPTYNGSSTFCKEVVEHCNACGVSTLGLNTCSLQNFAAVCEYETNLISAQFVAAEQTCATNCNADGGTTCVNAALADASLTTAQEKVVTDYCAHCGQSAGCAAQIASTLNVIEFSDTVATSIDTACTPDAGVDSGSCGTNYESCAFGVLLEAVNGAPCADAGKD